MGKTSTKKPNTIFFKAVYVFVLSEGGSERCRSKNA